MTPVEQLRNRINFLTKTVGVQIDAGRIQGFLDELESGSGRDLETLWSDILRHIAGSQRRVLADWVQSKFGDEQITGERMGRLVDELVSGERTFSQMEADIYEATGQQDVGGGQMTEEGAPEEENQATEGVGADEDFTILTSANMQWFFDPNSGLWYVTYSLPDSDRHLVFEATPEDMDALFGENQRPQEYQRMRFSQLTQQPGYTFAGDIAEMEGTGTFEAEYEQVIARALDEGTLPEWMMESNEWQDIIFIYTTEGKSEDWLINEVAQTDSFQQRFPALDAYRKQNNLDWGQAVSAFLEFEAGMRNLNEQFGSDADQVTPEVVSSIMAQGYSIEQVQTTYARFDRMREYAPALEAFNEILTAQGYDPLGPNEMIEFLEGTAPQEVYDIYEASSIQEISAATGLDEFLSADEAIERALATPGALEHGAISQSLQTAARQVLQFRAAIDVQKYGMDPEDLIDISLGIAPASGKTEAEIRETMDRLVRESQGFLEQQARPFVGFTAEGRPQARSLGGLRQTGL